MQKSHVFSKGSRAYPRGSRSKQRRKQHQTFKKSPSLHTAPKLCMSDCQNLTALVSNFKKEDSPAAAERNKWQTLAHCQAHRPHRRGRHTLWLHCSSPRIPNFQKDDTRLEEALRPYAVRACPFWIFVKLTERSVESYNTIKHEEEHCDHTQCVHALSGST